MPAASKRTPVTGEMVADAAGVSASVVSLVLNGKDAGRVGPATRQRVLAAAEQLRYRIDRRGRSLATGRTGLVAFVAPDSTTPYFAALQAELLRLLGPDDQLITIVTEVGAGVYRQRIDAALALGVDALIVAATDPALLASFEPTCPVLLLDSPGADTPFDRINLDVSSAARALGAHLAQLGHFRLASVDSHSGSRSMVERRAALEASFVSGTADPAAARDAHVAPRRGTGRTVVDVATCAIDVGAAREKVLSRWPRWQAAGVTAIACGSDVHAFGTISAFTQLGVAVPGDVSVVGADDQPMSTVVRPALTTVRLPITELGTRAVERIRTLLTERSSPRIDVRLPATVVYRDSTGNPPAAA